MSSERSSAKGSTGIADGPLAPRFWSSAGTPNWFWLIGAVVDGGSIFTTVFVCMMTAVFGAMSVALRMRIRLLTADPLEPTAACPGAGCAVIACEEDAL